MRPMGEIHREVGFILRGAGRNYRVATSMGIPLVFNTQRAALSYRRFHRLWNLKVLAVTAARADELFGRDWWVRCTGAG